METATGTIGIDLLLDLEKLHHIDAVFLCPFGPAGINLLSLRL